MSRSAALRRGEAIIFEGERDAPEDAWGVDEIQPVALQIQVALDFRPSELHACSAYTQRSFVKVVAAASIVSSGSSSSRSWLDEAQCRRPVWRETNAEFPDGAAALTHSKAERRSS